MIKKPCVGRKNYLHCGSVDGAKRLAAAYTLVLSCKGLGLNVNDNLVDVINKLAAGWPLSRNRELVPDARAAGRADEPVLIFLQLSCYTCKNEMRAAVSRPSYTLGAWPHMPSRGNRTAARWDRERRGW